MTPLAIVVSILFVFVAIGLVSAARLVLRRLPQPEPSPAAHGDVVTTDPRFHLEISAGALRSGDAGAGGVTPWCVAGGRTFPNPEHPTHA
jgi:hypothetical protein